MMNFCLFGAFFSKALRRAGFVVLLSGALSLQLHARESPPVTLVKGTPTLGIYQTEFLRTQINKDKDLTEAYDLLTEFQFEDALTPLFKCIKREPGSPSLFSEAHTLLGYVYMNLRKEKETRAHLKEALHLVPRNELAHYLLANEYFIEGDHEKTKTHLIEAVKIKANFVSALRMLGETLMDEGHPEEALPYYEKIVKALPSSGYYRFQMYRAYMAAHKLPEAEKTLLKLIEFEPGFLLNYSRLGDIYLEMGKLEEAKRAFSRVLEEDPRSPVGHLGMGKLYLKRDHLPEARKELETARKLQPNNLEVFKSLQMLKDREKESRFSGISKVGLSALAFSTILLILWILHLVSRRRHMLNLMASFNKQVDQIYDLAKLSEFILKFFRQILESDEGLILLFHRQNNLLFTNFSEGLSPEKARVHIYTGVEVSNWVRAVAKPLLTLKDLARIPQTQEAFPSLMERLESLDLQLVIPLLERNLLLGMVALHRRPGMRSPEKYARDLIGPITDLAAHAIEALYLYESSVTDETTGLYNKRYFIQTLSAEIRRAERYGQPFSLLTFDIDNFKRINDTFGHPQGDRVLKDLARIGTQSIREGIDILARTGGEEFHIILPAVGWEQAREVAERFRRKVEENPFLRNPDPLKVTVSMGLSTYPCHAMEEASLIQQADDALYQAKRTGKNRLCFPETLPTEQPAPVLRKMEGVPPDLPIWDEGSGLFNQAYFTFRLREELRRSDRQESPCSLILFSPRSNGKAPEDRIQGIASQVRASIRNGIDIPCLLPDGELAILFPETDEDRGAIISARLAGDLSSQFQAEYGKITYGAATYPKNAFSEEELFRKAREGLGGR
ncbi:MAG: diguanylate cyclase [Armatimonadetes bacterium]|nr:diguanylate cyclase [Armatimonadota bacterium]